MDLIENINGSLIQHGPHNNRIYLMRLIPNHIASLIAVLDEMASQKGYGKIFAKIPAPAWGAFRSAGYIKEAVVPGFFTGKIDGFFIAKYFSAGRQESPYADRLFRIVRRTGDGSSKERHPSGRATRDIVACKPSDAAKMSVFYRQAFKSYPFPIQQPAYLQHMMHEGVLYFCVRIEGRIAALSAAEIDLASENVEMTDFATLPEWRGRGFAGMLLSHMDKKACELGIKTAYTIARAASHGMNFVFNSNGYNYAGLLKNNTQICGSIQSMTVWYKHLINND